MVLFFYCHPRPAPSPSLAEDGDDENPSSSPSGDENGNCILVSPHHRLSQRTVMMNKIHPRPLRETRMGTVTCPKIGLHKNYLNG